MDILKFLFVNRMKNIQYEKKSGGHNLKKNRMSTTNSWSFNTIPAAATGSTKVFNRVITSRSDSGRFYEKHGDDSFPLLPVGVMLPFVGTVAPGGYLLCNGADVYRDAYPDLFAVIGTRYGEGDGSTTFGLPRLTGPTEGEALTVTVGFSVDKDMSSTGNLTLPGPYSPDGNGVTSDTQTASYWDDWDNDIFDEWGFFYLYDPATTSYKFLVFETINQADGVFATQTVTAFGGRTFTIVHGYAARGIYRIEVSCTSDSNPFQFGAYGEMGSDDSTINTNVDGTLTVNGSNYSFTYNKNQEEGDLTEILYAYFVPFETNQLGSNGKTYTENVDDDMMYYYTNQYTNGITAYFSKKNDVISFINADVRLLNGKIRGGRISLDENGDPVLGPTSKYIIKY